MTLQKLTSLDNKLVIGLMSGTSADGIDAALIEVRGCGTRTKFRQLAFLTHPFPQGLKGVLLSQSDSSAARIDTIARCDFLLGTLFAEAARRVARKGGKRIGNIHLIGSHGQTIHHLPKEIPFHGRRIRATFQIGNISVIAKHTGVITVGDFRSGDVAVGGSGAPLVPYFDFLAFRSRSTHRASLNIGGIANITVLPGNCRLDEVSAFDTGPGNMIIDGLMRRLFHKEVDRGGTTAARGKILPGLLQWMIRHPYFTQPPPKSTGRELFGERCMEKILHRCRKKNRADIIATVSEFTAMSIFDQYRRFIRRRTPLAELIVSGGGTHNQYLMEALRRYFSGVRIATSDKYSVDPDAKEAICFALLANETVSGNPSNVPRATGARRATILGTIALP